MAITANVYVEHPDLALSDTIEAVPEATLRVVSDAGTDPRHDRYFFAVETADRARFESVLRDDHTVEEWSVVSPGEDERVYAIRYADRAMLFTPKITEVDGRTLDARSRDGGWVLRLRLPDRKALYDLWEYARENDATFDIRQLYRVGDGTTDRIFGLTDAQREALVAAYNRGYFKEPREASLSDLAEALDISPTAAGGRLRRGMDRLVGATLVGTDEE